MLIVMSIVIFSMLGALAIVVREVRNAPEGYEDESGFHTLPVSHRDIDLPSAGISAVGPQWEDAEVGRPIPRRA